RPVGLDYRRSRSVLGLLGATREPRGAARIQTLDFGAFERGHVRLDREAEPGLQVSEMTIAFGKLRQQSRVELELRRWIENVEPILLVDGLPQHDRPSLAALLEEVVETARAHDVAGHTVDGGALRNRHLRLGDGANARDIDCGTSQKVQDVDVLVE